MVVTGVLKRRGGRVVNVIMVTGEMRGRSGGGRRGRLMVDILWWSFLLAKSESNQLVGVVQLLSRG